MFGATKRWFFYNHKWKCCCSFWARPPTTHHLCEGGVFSVFFTLCMKVIKACSSSMTTEHQHEWKHGDASKQQQKSFPLWIKRTSFNLHVHPQQREEGVMWLWGATLPLEVSPTVNEAVMNSGKWFSNISSLTFKCRCSVNVHVEPKGSTLTVGFLQNKNTALDLQQQDIEW